MKRYEAMVDGEWQPRYLLLRALRVGAPIDAPLPRLWGVHDRAVERFRRACAGGKMPEGADGGASLLDLKATIARRLLARCVFCRRRCAVDREAGEEGFCGVGAQGVVGSEFLHLGEEPELVPSHTIFFRGCTQRCAYCQNWDLIPSKGRGFQAEPEQIARLIEVRAGQSSANVNWVGGDPTPNLHTVLETLTRLRAPLAQVWNSNMYYSEETARLLDGAMDVYLADVRYGNDACAERLSSAPEYWGTVTRNVAQAHRSAGVLIRHLVLPGHLECCTRTVVEWCARELGPGVRFNLMFQYRPEHRAREQPGLDCRLTREECRRAEELASKAGLRNLV